jgi:type IV pilus assembly protein PilW
MNKYLTTHLHSHLSVPNQSTKKPVTVKTRQTRIKQLGMSLVEVMISITLGLVVVGSILSVYLSTARSSQQNIALARMNEDAAIAMAFIGNYLRVTGYSPPQILVTAASFVSSGIEKSVVDRHLTQNSIRACDNGFTNPKAEFDLLTCSATIASGKSALALRFEGDTDDTQGTGTTPGDCLSNPVSVETVSNMNPELNYKLIDNRIFIANNDNSGAPELNCIGNGGDGVTAISPQAIVESVESMFLLFGLADMAGNKLVTSYLTQTDLEPTNAPVGTTESRWGRVISVKVCLVMRSQNPVPEGGGNYIGCDGGEQNSSDRFLRRSFTNTYTLRNRV